MVNPHLPQEILLQIFSKLPARSVVKFRVLSKSWNTELSTSHFIKNHLISRKQTIQPENLALTSSSDVNTVFIITSSTKKHLQVSGNYYRFEVVGSCDGLILLNNLILFNPITRKNVWIPPCSTKYRRDTALGFGYDSLTDDYKIVQISSYASKGDLGMIQTTPVDVYSVKNRVWKRVVDDYPDGQFVMMNFSFRSGAFVNGALHWLVGNVRPAYRRCIAAFDLANEVFRDIPLPEGFVRQLQDNVPICYRLYRSSGVSVVSGCLLIVDNHGVDGTADIWIQGEYGVEESWVKFRIRYGNGNYEWKIWATLCYVDDGELLCQIRGSSGNFVCALDLKRRTARRLVDDVWVTSGMTFVDSLVSPGGHGRRMGNNEHGC